MKKVMIAIWALIVNPHINAQLVVRGKLVNIELKGDFYYNEPLDGFSHVTYNPKKIFFEKDNSFEIITDVKKEGFLHVSLPGKLVKLFVTPNDTISFVVTYAVDAQTKENVVKTINFKGKNAEGHELYNSNLNYLNNQAYILRNSFANNYLTVGKLIEAVKVDLRTLLRPFDSLYEQGKVTEKFFRATAAGIRSTFNYHVINLFGFFYNNKEVGFSGSENLNYIRNARTANYHLFTSDNFDKLRKMVYEDFDPLDSNILYTSTGAGLIDYYCKDLYTGLVERALAYDSSFLRLNESKRYLGYLHDRFLELIWGNLIYWSAAVEQDEEDLRRNYKMFISYFPHSSFLPYLKARLNNVLKDKSFNSSVLKEINFLITKKYASLKELLTTNFKNQYVFIDIWATWCSPCIREFMYKNELKTFLDKKDIKILYISIDETVNEDKWKRFVENKKLYGSHYLASQELRNQIKKQLNNGNSITIPRYLLINKSGEIIIADLPRPSDMETLKKVIYKGIKRTGT